MSTKGRVGLDITANDNSAPAFASAMGRIKALNKVAETSIDRQRNLVFQLNDVFTSLAGGINPAMVLAQQGPQIAQIYGFGRGGVAQAFKDVGSMIVGVATRVPLLTAGAVALGAGLGILQYEVNKTSGAAYSMGEVFTAAWQVIRDGIANLVSPAFTAMGTTAATVLDAVLGYFKTWGNGLIAVNVAWFRVVKGLLELLPAAFKLAGGAAGDFFIAGIESMINKAGSLINSFVDGINAVFDKLPDWANPGKLGQVPKITLPRFDAAPSLDDLKKQFGDVLKNVGDSFSTDYLGNFLKGVSAQAAQNRLKAANDNGKTAGGAGRGGVGRASPFNEFTHPLYGGDWNKVRTDIAGVTEEMSALQQVTDGVKGLFQSLFDKAINGGLKFKDVLGELQRFGSQLASSFFSKALDQMFQPSHGLYGGGGGIFGNIIGNLFGGFRAAGGPVAAGKSYVVGENGPELLRMGASSGTIIPSLGTGAAPMNVTINNNVGAQVDTARDERGNMVVDINRAVDRAVDKKMRTQYGLNKMNKAR